MKRRLVTTGLLYRSQLPGYLENIPGDKRLTNSHMVEAIPCCRGGSGVGTLASPLVGFRSLDGSPVTGDAHQRTPLLPRATQASLQAHAFSSGLIKNLLPGHTRKMKAPNVQGRSYHRKVIATLDTFTAYRLRIA